MAKKQASSAASKKLLQKRFLSEFAKSGLVISQACEAMQIHRNDFYIWYNSQDDNSSFRQQVDNLREQIILKAEDVLNVHLNLNPLQTNPELALAILKTRAKHMGWNNDKTVMVTGSNPEDKNITINIVEKTKDNS